MQNKDTKYLCEFTLIMSVFPFHYFRMLFNKRLLSGSQSSHSNLSQASVTSDLLSADEVESPINAQHPKIAERRSNCSSDIQGEKKSQFLQEFQYKTRLACASISQYQAHASCIFELNFKGQ